MIKKINTNQHAHENIADRPSRTLHTKSLHISISIYIYINLHFIYVHIYKIYLSLSPQSPTITPSIHKLSTRSLSLSFRFSPNCRQTLNKTRCPSCDPRFPRPFSPVHQQQSPPQPLIYKYIYIYKYTPRQHSVAPPPQT